MGEGSAQEVDSLLKASVNSKTFTLCFQFPHCRVSGK